MRRCAAVAIAAAVAVAARAQDATPPPPQPVTVQVLLPQPLADLTVAALRERFAARVEWIVSPAVAGFEPIPGAVLFGVDELDLHRLAGAGRLAPLPPRSSNSAARRAGETYLRLEYTFAYRPGAFDAPPGDWEALALHPAVRERLGLAAPAVDPAPWLAAMLQALRRGGTERDGYALWTTLDARLQRSGLEYPAVRAALAAGTLNAAVLPAALVRGERALPDVVLAPTFDGLPEPRFGVAIAAPAGEASNAVARELQSTAVLASLAPLGLAIAPPAGDGLDPAVAGGWLAHLQRSIAGRGRAVEGIADTLDIVFFVLFVAILAVVWWRTRRGDADRDPDPDRDRADAAGGGRAAGGP